MVLKTVVRMVTSGARENVILSVSTFIERRVMTARQLKIGSREQMVRRRGGGQGNGAGLLSAQAEEESTDELS